MWRASWPLPCSQQAVDALVYLMPGAFEIEINGQLVFSKLENGGFPYEKDVSIRGVGSTPGSPCLCSTSSHTMSPPSSSSRPSGGPVTENP